jgi:hypothetical protein
VHDEVLLPIGPPGVEEESNFLGLRINSGEVCSFVKIAVMASESEISQVIGATVFFGHDVFDVKAGESRQ